MSEPWNAYSLEEVYARMVRSGADFVVVGGQAVNLWAESSQGSSVLPLGVWETLRPFASRDLDCLGGSLDAWKVGQAFGVEPRVYGALGKAWVPTAADLDLPMPGARGTLLVEFLHTLKGVGSSEVEETARELAWAGVTLRVLHPVLCLEAKLANLSELVQEATGRQDHKHARLSCLSLRVFIARCLTAGREREARGLTQRVLTLAGKQNALRAWYDHGLCVEESVPLPEMQAAARAGEGKLENFLALNWGRLQESLLERRTHFAALMREQGRQPCAVRSLLGSA